MFRFLPCERFKICSKSTLRFLYANARHQLKSKQKEKKLVLRFVMWVKCLLTVPCTNFESYLPLLHSLSCWRIPFKLIVRIFHQTQLQSNFKIDFKKKSETFQCIRYLQLAIHSNSILSSRLIVTEKKSSKDLSRWKKLILYVWKSAVRTEHPTKVSADA